jgi:hypothetical protein
MELARLGLDWIGLRTYDGVAYAQVLLANQITN